MKLFARRSSRSARRTRLSFESLEHRTLLAGDLLVSTEVPGQLNYNLMEYSQQGALVHSQKIPQSPTATEYQEARGLTVDPSGDVHIVDGSYSAFLDTYSPGQTPAWSYQTAPGWALGGNISYGEAAAYKNYVFASSMGSANGSPYGIIRFNTACGAPTLFATGTSAYQVTLGLDGNLYELVGKGYEPYPNPTINEYNPDTLALVRSFHLSTAFMSDIRSIAVDASGNVYAADWSAGVTKYDPNGTPLKSLGNFGQNLMNVAIDDDGQIAIGGRLGGVYLTNESLDSLQSFQTNQWQVFVTFDHYIGVVPQVVTPTFSSLAGPTITYGDSAVALGGTISAGSSIPPGNVSITVAGVTETAAINPANGSFSAVFDTSGLGVSGSPYKITYSYSAQGDYAAVTDASKSLTVVQATTTLNDLSSPTIVVGTQTVTLSGMVGANSPALPAGQDVTVTLVGPNGTLATSSGVIGSDGSFEATIAADSLPVGAYTIEYAYAGDANFTASSGAGMLQVTYAVTPLFDNSKPVRAGAALPVKLQLNDAAGDNLSSANVTMTAVSLVGPDGQTYVPQAKGNANPNNVFRHVGYGYLYNLDTTGLAPGKYTLLVKAGDDPVLHAVTFEVD